MEILISEDFKVVEDSLNFILLRRTQSDPNHHFSKGTAKENWKLVGYYVRVDYLINTLMKYSIKEEEKNLLNQLATNVNKVKQELTLELTQLMNKTFPVIKVGKDYQITQDSFNYILSKRKESDANHHFSKGIVKESWKSYGYFGKIEHLVHSLVERTIKDLDVTELEQLVKEVAMLRMQLKLETTNIIYELNEKESDSYM